MQVVVLAVVVPGSPRRALLHRAPPPNDDAAPSLRLELPLRLPARADHEPDKVEVGVLLLRDVELLALLLRPVVVRGPVRPVGLDELLDEVLPPLGEVLPRADLARVEPDPPAVVDGLGRGGSLRRGGDLPVVLAEAALGVGELAVEREHGRVVRLLGGPADDGGGELDHDASGQGELARARGGREREGGGGRGGDVGHRDLAGALRRLREDAGRHHRRERRRRHRRRRWRQR